MRTVRTPATAPKPVDVPHPLGTWPWPGVREEALAPGVRHWIVKGADGTTCDLLRFNRGANPKLRLEIYDQDEDDGVPFDNRTDFWPMGVAAALRHLSTRGQILAVWNGLFFGYDRSPGTPPNGLATHIGPAVIRGQARYNVGNHRWTFGVKHGLPKVVLLPSFGELGEQFDFAATGAQCLIRDGKLLRLEPFGSTAPRRPPTADEAGHIPLVDHMRTSRTSMGWNRDGRVLYLLFVSEPDTETASKLAVKYGGDGGGGWTIYDLQRFWKALGVWGAINSDGGSVAQLAYANAGGAYEVLPPRSISTANRFTLRPTDEPPGGGGTLMYFYVVAR